jgi:hypothetical protein
MMMPVVADIPRPGGPFVFVATCPVCGASVWTYRRAQGLARIGPHYLGPKRAGARRPWCAGGGQEAPGARGSA